MNAAYKQFEELVKNGILEIKGDHYTDANRTLTSDQEFFLREMKRSFNYLLFDPEEGLTSLNHCQKCGKYLAYDFEDNALVPRESKCFSLDENPKFSLSVPSGELLFIDWFHTKPDVLILQEDISSLKSLKGMNQLTEQYAKNNVGHFYVMNTSPFIFQKENNLFIGRPSSDDPFIENAKEIGRVITDLWWVTAIDKAVYEEIARTKLGVEEAKEFVDWHSDEAHVKVKVEPGVYELEYFYENPGYEKIYASMKKTI